MGGNGNVEAKLAGKKYSQCEYLLARDGTESESNRYHGWVGPFLTTRGASDTRASKWLCFFRSLLVGEKSAVIGQRQPATNTGPGKTSRV